MKRNILIIDDDVAILDALELMLTEEKYGVTVSTNGDSIFRKVDENKKQRRPAPDVIVMDVFLSGKDGRTICKKIKHDESTKNIPVIMISAHPDIKKSVLIAGADAFLAKPFDSNDLVNQIQHVLQA